MIEMLSYLNCIVRVTGGETMEWSKGTYSFCERKREVLLGAAGGPRAGGPFLSFPVAPERRARTPG